MEMNDVQSLIEVFKGYRELLTPIQSSLQELADTYSSMEDSLNKLGATFNGDTKNRLNEIYSTLENQTKKSIDLAASVDQFLRNSSKYSNDISRMSSRFEDVEKSINQINEIEREAKSQISKLEGLIEEKKINYNVKDLQRSLEQYNTNVQKISEFINKDVASVLSENSKKIEELKKDNEILVSQIEKEHGSIEELVKTYSTTKQFLVNAVEKEDVNEEYIFAILDKWANTRGVKIKK